MTSEEQISKLEKIFKKTLYWYESHLTTNPKDSEDYLYDSTIDHITDNLTRGDAIDIIETLRGF